MFLGTLEGVAADDRAESAAVADGAGFIEHCIVAVFLGAAGEDHDAMAVEGGLHHMPDALGQRGARHVSFFVSLLGLGLLEVFRGQFHLDHVRAQFRGNVGGVGGHVQRRLALLGKA